MTNYKSDIARLLKTPYMQRARAEAEAIALRNADYAAAFPRVFDQLPDVEPFAAKVPSLRIIIDHVANVPITPPPHPNRWVSGLAGCHYSPNVVMKVSGLVEGSGKRGGQAPTDLEFYRPVLDAVWHIFGEDRLLYASNWPVSALFADYATVQRLAVEYFTAKGPRTVGKVFRTNAAHVYRTVHR